jgi:hypothetical protein
VSAHRGKRAELELVDQSAEIWGHIMLDEAVQWVADAPAPN